jgi:hydroxyacylglutathione hydrolase
MVFARSIPLEDTFTDVLGKAMRGLGLSAAALAEKAGVPAAALQAVLDGQADAAVLEKLAPVLGLNAPALCALAAKSWFPEQHAPFDGLAGFNTPFDDMTVNSYLVWDPSSLKAAAFDTGADATEMLATIGRHGLKLETLFLTHTHGDHVLETDRILEKTGARAVVGSREPFDGAETFEAGKTFHIGALTVGTRLTWGHSKGGVTYVVDGLELKLAVVGDAVFAGSMGGGGISYADALATNRKEILSLPDETILCPGHGPLTSVGQEKKHNPFLAL